MSPSIVLLFSILGWAGGTFLSLLLAGWCKRFITSTARSRARGWWLAVLIVSPFAVAAVLGCMLMTIRYGLHLVVLTWPHLAEFIPLF